MRARIQPTAFVALCALAAVGWLALRPDAAVRTADKYMRAQAIASGFSGTVLLARGGGVLFEHGYGYADIDRHLRNTGNTQYRIGSITKSFTGMLVLKLQEEGLLSVSDPICSYLDTCPDAWSRITIHELLSHTSGIPSSPAGEDYLEKTGKPATHEQVIAEFRELPLGFEPGERFEYSNSNYYLLGTIVERVTGETYSAALRRRILEPLHLDDSFVDLGDPAARRIAVGYRPDDNGELDEDSPLDPSWSFAAGGLFSTVEDLLRTSVALDSTALLSEASKTAMWTPVAEDYGYGWRIREPAPETLNRRVVMHSGRTQGYTACFVRFPDDGLTGIVLSNNVMADTCPIVRDLAAIFLDEPFSIPVARRAIEVDSAVLDRYVGRYRLSDSIVFTISRPTDLLVVQFSQSPDRFPLYAESPTSFFQKTFHGQLTFHTNRRGEVSSATITAQGRTLSAERLPDE